MVADARRGQGAGGLRGPLEPSGVSDHLDVVLAHVGHFHDLADEQFPLDLLQLATDLRSAGLRVECLKTPDVIRLTDAQLRELFQMARPRIVMLHVGAENRDAAARLGADVRSWLPDTRVLACGPLAADTPFERQDMQAVADSLLEGRPRARFPAHEMVGVRPRLPIRAGARPVSQVVAEATHDLQTYAARVLDFIDDDLLADPAWATDLARSLSGLQENAPRRFAFTCRGASADPSLLRALAEAGLAQLVLPGGVDPEPTLHASRDIVVLARVPDLACLPLLARFPGVFECEALPNGTDFEARVARKALDDAMAAEMRRHAESIRRPMVERHLSWGRELGLATRWLRDVLSRAPILESWSLLRLSPRFRTVHEVDDVADWYPMRVDEKRTYSPAGWLLLPGWFRKLYLRGSRERRIYELSAGKLRTRDVARELAPDAPVQQTIECELLPLYRRLDRTYHVLLYH